MNKDVNKTESMTASEFERFTESLSSESMERLNEVLFAMVQGIPIIDIIGADEYKAFSRV
jgi:hypothetical protein